MGVVMLPGIAMAPEDIMDPSPGASVKLEGSAWPAIKSEFGASAGAAKAADPAGQHPSSGNHEANGIIADPLAPDLAAAVANDIINLFKHNSLNSLPTIRQELPPFIAISPAIVC